MDALAWDWLADLIRNKEELAEVVDESIREADVKADEINTELNTTQEKMAARERRLDVLVDDMSRITSPQQKRPFSGK